MKLLDLVRPDAIVAELSARDKGGVIRELVGVLAGSGAIPAADVEGIAKAILTRERTRGTTGLGKGMATPHAKLAGLSQAVVAVGRSSVGIDFGALDGAPVRGFFLLLSPAERAEEHLKAMDLVFRHLQQERFRKFLIQSDKAEKIYDLLREADEKALPA
jgi:mannitol/fructose-specific phosphotransferase system IIA component (Ntr-type)